MTRLIYIANNRLPTEKAHGLQIVQMCEAFAGQGYDVTLVTARRINTPNMRKIDDLWAHYGVRKTFEFVRIPCLDLIDRVPTAIQRPFFMLQTLTYMLCLLVWLPFQRGRVFYTRDLFIGVMLASLPTFPEVAYEVHQVHHSRLGRMLQSYLVRNSHVIPITGHLAAKMRDRGALRWRVEHDGFRPERFADLPSRAEARSHLDIAAGAFVVGYVGRLHTMGMSKGLDTLVDAVTQAAQRGADVHVLVVGGPGVQGVDGVADAALARAAQGLGNDRVLRQVEFFA